MVAVLPLLLLAAGPAAVSGSGRVDFLVGDWAIYDQAGKQVGTSHVDAQVPGSMLLEMRRVDGEPQPLWCENSERDGGWIQLFIGPKGQIRAFTPVSKPGEWPLVIGADVVLQDGIPARFRVTMPQPHDRKSLRKLEMSKDSGRSWSTVFAYEYRRVKP
jgi:hypothetical protein